ncbi:DUF4157 domain-containing protein [Streptomyces sp. NPDC058145]|uniref:eCIS core domain-containing protein n=1 Tax=Streptomyces sp. NPDC058145 TaxID=3346356 RepID=UPI0036E6594D
MPEVRSPSTSAPRWRPGSGADFSDVRLHTGTVAQRSADELGARAYTSASDIVLGRGAAGTVTLWRTS